MKKVKEGDIVAVKWLDSGRSSHTRNTPLATRWVYGRVTECENEDTLTLAMDVCTGQDEHDDSGNQWGHIWKDSIKELIILEPKRKKRKKLSKRDLNLLQNMANTISDGDAKVALEKAIKCCS